MPSACASLQEHAVSYSQPARPGDLALPYASLAHPSLLPLAPLQPECKCGVNDKVLFETQGRSGRQKAVDLEDVKFHQVGGCRGPRCRQGGCRCAEGTAAALGACCRVLSRAAVAWAGRTFLGADEQQSLHRD